MVAAIVIVMWKLTASLSSDVFERRASTENEFFFSPLICPDALVDVRRSEIERLRFTFTPNSKREFVPRD